MEALNTGMRFVVCINNNDCEDLEIRKLYQVLPDEQAAKDNYIRVLDESGEDYLYPANRFVAVEVPQSAQDVLLAAA